MAEGSRRSGRCLCGAVRFAATPSSVAVDACHCGMCRRWTGGVYLAAACDDVTIENEDALGVYRSSEYGERVFCRRCGSSLIWRMQDGSAAHVAISALDDVSGFALEQEIFIDEKPGFYEFANPTKKLTGAEFAAQFVSTGENSGG